ncbi:cysteine methyltransferase [Alteromonas portus]|uniref:Cysteine methyltransferase n=1 Tax=Alteromonas portus TaxID=2565549 RepID=A0A4U0ZGP8_9ALTE|nr:MGMT family protein [Alteromonas portus]TKB02593.1 cysteine methyltransferase [Alteromonas portus]
MPHEAVQSRIEKTLSLVPEGHVISYALLADLCGLPGRARLMGKCLKQIDANYHWHRVLRADGKIAFPAGSDKADEQRERLTEEGVVVKNYRVNMRKFGWTPDLHTILVELEY